MTVLHWFDAQCWQQRLRSCSPRPCRRSVRIYPFSMEEIYFQLLRQAKLELPADSYAKLDELYRSYVRQTPSFDLKLEELIVGGWLDCFCDRWSLTRPIKESYIASAEDARAKAAMGFLLWLQEQVPVDRSAVYLEDWDTALAEIHLRCPEAPDTDWFLRQNILWEDRSHIHQFSRNLDPPAMHRALARLLAQAKTPAEQARWAELAHQLQVSEDIMEEIPSELQKTVVSLMAGRVLSGKIPTVQEENQRILRENLMMRDQFPWKLPDTDVIAKDDPLERIYRAEQSFREDSFWFYHRVFWKSLEISIVLRGSGSIPGDRRDALLTRVEDLHSLGFLDACFLPPEACLELLAYPQTRFVALHSLARLHRQQSAAGENSAGDCVLSWLSFALPHLKPGEGASINQLLLYLAKYAYRETRRNYADARLLEGILEQLSRCYFTNEPLLTAITDEITTCLESVVEDVAQGQRFLLLNDWAAHLYRVVPADQRPHSLLFRTMCHSLAHYLDRLLNEPFSAAAAFIPSTIFECPHWPAVYESLDYEMRFPLLNCVMSWYADRNYDHRERFYARYQFQLGLGWLTVLAQMPGAEKYIVLIWLNFLFYVLNEKNQLLTIEYHESAADHGELKRAIQTLRHDMPGIETFLKRISSLRTAELVLLVQYCTDIGLRNIFLREIEEHSRENDAAMDLYNWDQLVSYVLEQKIQLLFSICETRLNEHLAWGRRQKYTHPIFDRDHRQLSYLWMLRGDYELLFSKGHPYVQALALLEGPNQNLRKAASSWEALANETREPSTYTYWMLSYVRQLEKIPKNHPDQRQEIYQKIEVLRQLVEKGLFINWETEEQLRYADILAGAWKEQGFDRALIVKQASQVLSLPEETLADRWGELLRAPDTVVKLPPAPVASGKQMEAMLLRFLSLPLASKSSLYFNCRSAAAPEQSDTALVFLELFRTLYHLSNYGDKLLVNGKLDEDHCTQLLREIFNLNGSEWWKLSANDQEQSGSTGKIRKNGLNVSAENDFLVKSENYTYLFVESLVLEYLDRTGLENHLEKLIGDNIQNAPMVLVIYGNSFRPQELWERVKSYVRNQFPMLAESLEIHMTSFIEFRDCALYIPELYAPLEQLVRHSMIAYVSHHGVEKLPLVIAYVDIGKRAHIEISQDARS